MGLESDRAGIRTKLSRYLCFTDDTGYETLQKPKSRSALFRPSLQSGHTKLWKQIRQQDDDDGNHTSVPDATIECIFRVLLEDKEMLTYCCMMRVCKQFARVGTALLPPRPKCPSLPDEILLEIFAAVRFNSASADPVSDLASSLRVCQQWFRTGMPLLYKNFVMDVNYKPALSQSENSYSSTYFPVAFDRYDFIPSARFYDTANKLWSQPWTDSGLGSWIVSLSIEIHFHEPEIHQPHKQSMMDIVNELPNLRTLSVRAAPLRQNNQMRKANFVHLVGNLPARIVNFELDLQSRDTTYDVSSSEKYSLCRALATILPQLRTLRLRLASICILFLQELNQAMLVSNRVYPNLRTLSISTYTKDFTMAMSCCSPAGWPNLNPPSVVTTDTLQARISDLTIFPNLKACSLVCLRNDMSTSGMHSMRIICQTLDPDLRTWKKRAYFPRSQGFAQSLYVRTDPGGDESEAIMQGYSEDVFATYMSYFPESVKLMHGQETDAVFEGSAGWTEDAFGARYPPPL